MITLSERAQKEILRIKQDQKLPDDIRIRVGVKGGGCSGFSYSFGFDDGPTLGDDMVFKDNDIEILCDGKSFLYLNGIEIDFEESLMGRGFRFKNPNARNNCGCGESFSV